MSEEYLTFFNDKLDKIKQFNTPEKKTEALKNICWYGEESVPFPSSLFDTKKSEISNI